MNYPVWTLKLPVSLSFGMLDFADEAKNVLTNYNKMVEKSTNF
jgi:hypothetical protein